MRTDITAAALIQNEKGQIVIVDQGDETYSIVKGKLERGEKMEAALEREIYEETGLNWNRLKMMEKLGVYERFRMNKTGGDDKRVKKIIHVFLFRTGESKLEPQESDVVKAIWVDKDKAVKMLTHRKDKEFLKNIIDKLK